MKKNLKKCPVCGSVLVVMYLPFLRGPSYSCRQCHFKMYASERS